MQAMKLASYENFGNMIFDGDFRSFIEELRDGGAAVPKRIRNFVAGVRLLSESFANVTFSQVNPKANKAAHSIAKWSMLNSVFVTFDLGNSPTAFINVILDEACQ